MFSVRESIVQNQLIPIAEGVHHALVKILESRSLNGSVVQILKSILTEDRRFWVYVDPNHSVLDILEQWCNLIRDQGGCTMRHDDTPTLLRFIWVTLLRRLTLCPQLLFVEKQESNGDALKIMELFLNICRECVYNQFAITPVKTLRESTPKHYSHPSWRSALSNHEPIKEEEEEEEKDDSPDDREEEYDNHSLLSDDADLDTFKKMHHNLDFQKPKTKRRDDRDINRYNETGRALYHGKYESGKLSDERRHQRREDDGLVTIKFPRPKK